MAVQQNKKSPSKRGMHRSHDFLTNPPLAVVPTTGEVHLRHHVGPTGYYPGKKVAKGIRVIVIPATQAIYLQAIEEGLVQIFIKAGAIVSTPTCGPCLGGYMGILAAGERAVATTNRNFRGRMGHVDSEVYLAGPYVAAASAILGKIALPEEVK